MTRWVEGRKLHWLILAGSLVAGNAFAGPVHDAWTSPGRDAWSPDPTRDVRQRSTSARTSDRFGPVWLAAFDPSAAVVHDVSKAAARQPLDPQMRLADAVRLPASSTRVASSTIASVVGHDATLPEPDGKAPLIATLALAFFYFLRRLR